MKLNSRRVAGGLVALGLAGGLAGGGVALAATNDTTSPASTVSAVTTSDGHCGGMAGMFGQDSPMAAAASYLGLSRAALQQQMHGGESLADIAKAQGRSVAGLKDAMVAMMRKNLDANTALTAAQKSAILAQLNSRVDTMVAMTHSSGMDMDDMGAHMGGMMSR